MSGFANAKVIYVPKKHYSIEELYADIYYN